MSSLPSISSGSEEDDRASSDLGDSAKRKARRRRGKRTHRRAADSPASERPSTSMEASAIATATATASRRRRRTNSVGAPPAPYNTTRFLLEDKEVRDDAEAVEVKRARSSSVGDVDRKHSGHGAEEECSSSSDGDMSALSNEERRERLLEDEFEDDYREAAFQKYAEMNHTELARTMVEVEARRDRVAEELDAERSKNAQLQAIIQSANLTRSPIASPRA